MGDKDEGRKITDKFARTMQDHHSNFRKEAGLSESRQTFRERLLAEKVGPSLVHGAEKGDYAGIPQPDDATKLGNPMMNPQGVAAEPGSNSTVGDPGQMDANGEEVSADVDQNNQGMGDMSGSGVPGAGAPMNMVRSIKGAFPDHFGNFCADGSC